jgi:hypothetical protein
MVVVAGLALLVGASRARADESGQTAPSPSRTLAAPSEPGANHPAESDGDGARLTGLVLGAPGLDLDDKPSPAAAPSLFRRWWFWSAVGVVAAATLATIVVSSRGQAPPATDLGNQEFHP